MTRRKIMKEWPTELPAGRWEYRPVDSKTGAPLSPIRGRFESQTYGIVFRDDNQMSWMRHEFDEGEAFAPVTSGGKP